MRDSVFDPELERPCIHVSVSGVDRNKLGQLLPLDSSLHPWSVLYKDQQEQARAYDLDEFITLEVWDKLARSEPDRHWVIVADTPMWACAWERQPDPEPESPGRWAVCAVGDGHADDDSAFDFSEALKIVFLAGQRPEIRH